MFSNFLKRSRRAKISAQGMTEYIIIVGLVAVFLIVAVRAFGTTLNAGFAGGTVQVDTQVNAPIGGTKIK